jgi:hypothetical protein
MVTCAIECPDGRAILTRWYEETLEHAIDAGDYNARARRLIVAVRRADANGMSEETLTSTVESILSDTWNEAIEEVLTTLSKEHSRKARVT